MAQTVLIAGAGLGGLLLAQSLRRHRIPFALFERDRDGTSRSQGYRLRISVDGLAALEEVLEPAHYARFRAGCTDLGGARPEAIDALTMRPQSLGAPTGPAGGGDVVGVERTFLRRILFEAVEAAATFGRTVTGYALQDGGGVAARFADGTTSPTGAMLVGADGLRSLVTRQLTKGALVVYDTGVRMIHGSSPVAAFDGLGAGVFSIRDDNRAGGRIGLITNTMRREQAACLGWVLVGSPGSFSAPNDDFPFAAAAPFDPACGAPSLGNPPSGRLSGAPPRTPAVAAAFTVTGKPAADLSRQLTARWHDRLRPIFEAQLDDEAVFLKMSTSSPDGVPVWANEPRVTLLGDAVHAMPPAGGVGANTALRDAALLGRLLGEAGGWNAGITAAYEQEMRTYASPNVKMSFERASRLFAIPALTTTIA
jgi:2-polyprenyl-6-methoxyphenol hydroxylase-like FAD-dependent oxidoreductase